MDFSLNIAEWSETHKAYYHFARVELPEHMPEEAVLKARRITKHFPEPQFKCELHWWERRGHTVPMEHA